jgi:hypothetical protein
MCAAVMIGFARAVIVTIALNILDIRIRANVLRKSDEQDFCLRR